MKSSGQLKTVGFGAALAMALAAGQVSADKSNPYLTIAERNAFGLGDPPPPPAPPAKPEPPKPVSTVRLTGITTILKKARALFEIVEAPGKPTDKPIMLVGDKVGDIELLAINVEKNMVTIRQSGQETNLVLEARKAPAPPPGQRPGMAPGLRPGFPPPGVKMPGQQTAAVNPGGAAPTVITPGSSGPSSGRSGVITMSGSSSTATTAAGPAVPGAPVAPGAAAGFSGSGRPAPYRMSAGALTTPGVPPAYNTPVPNAASLRVVPQRTARTQTMAGPGAPDPDMEAAKVLLNMHLNEMANPGDGPPPIPIE